MNSELQMEVRNFARRIAKVYQTLEWEWSGPDDVLYVPDALDIANTLRGLIEMIECQEHSRTETGGLYVVKSDDGIEIGMVIRETDIPRNGLRNDRTASK